MLKREDLHKYQNTGVNHIIDNNYCALFLDMGLGKTVTTLTAIYDLIYDYVEISTVLVVAPKRVAETVWSDECDNWEHLNKLRISKIIGNKQERLKALSTKAEIYIISRDNIAWLCSLYGGHSLPFDMLVIDELSSIKSYKSLRFKSLRQVRPSFKRVVGLTGTPAPNGLIDLWPQIFILDRGDRLEKTISRYRDKYFRPGKKNGAIVYSYSILENSESLIHEKVKDICISMKAEDYLEMPERIDNYIKIKMPPQLKQQYIDFEKNKILELYSDCLNDEESINQISVVNAAALSNKLLQFSNGAVYDEDRNVHVVHDLKIEALKELIDDANGKPILVAWTFQHDRDRIMEALKAYKPRELKVEKDIRDWNEGKVQVMLAHPASAGHGLNLQSGGSIIVWFGQTWSLELYQQFNGRVYRQGQKHGVIINHIILEGSHDEDVIKALSGKNKTQSSLMESVKCKVLKYIKNTNNGNIKSAV